MCGPHSPAPARFTRIRPGEEWVDERAWQWNPPGDDLEPVKGKRSHRVFRVRVGRRVYYAKHYRVKRLGQIVAAALFGSKAWREWRVMNQCERRGIEAPRAVACGRNPGLLYRESCLLTTEAPGVLLSEQLARPNADRDALLEEAGRLARRLHEGGLFHADLSARNIIVAPDMQRMVPIDLASSYFSPLLPTSRKVHNLMQILRSLPPSSHRDEAREALVRGYEAVGPARRVAGAFRKRAVVS